MDGIIIRPEHEPDRPASHPLAPVRPRVKAGVFSVLGAALVVGIIINSLGVVTANGLNSWYGNLPSYAAASSLTIPPPAVGPGTATPCAPVLARNNSIRAENACPGSSGWEADLPFGNANAIMGFTNPASVNAGGTFSLFVSTTAAEYSFQIFRVGWYGGLGGRLLYSSPWLKGKVQPRPLFDPVTHEISCANWSDPLSLRTPAAWTSGVYIIKLVSADGYMRYALFVVRKDNRAAAIRVQLPTNTYQAYNEWGGYSLYYGHNGAGKELFSQRSYVVSYDRPYEQYGGLGDFPRWDSSLILWLERQGYDMTYQTDVDLHLADSERPSYRLLLLSGHNEYWSSAMRQQATAQRDEGISLAFFGANDIFWHMRMQDSPLGPAREIVCYKDASLDPLAASDPEETTVKWWQTPFATSESLVLGEMYKGSGIVPSPLVLTSAAAPFLRGTALHAGSALPGLIGGEIDAYEPSWFTPQNVRVIAHSPVHCQVSVACPDGETASDSTIYVAPSGAKVFDAGTFQWSWGLLDAPTFGAAPRFYSSPGFQRFTANLLSYLLASPAR